MALVGAVQQVVGHDVEFGHLAPADHDVGAGGEVQQGVAGRARLGGVGAVYVVLCQVALDVGCHEGVVQAQAGGVAVRCAVVVGVVVAHGGMGVVCQLPLQLRGPAGRGGEGQVAGVVGLVQQSRIDIREGVGQVQRVDGVDIDAGLETQQSGVALGVGVGLVVGVGRHQVALQVDVVVDAVGKQRHLGTDVARGEVQPQVGLQAVFRLQLLVAALVSL